MIDKEKIPESLYSQLVELYGADKAEYLILKNEYNYHELSMIALGESVIRRLNLEPFRDWIGNSFGISLRKLFGIMVIFGLVLYVAVSLL